MKLFLSGVYVAAVMGAALLAGSDPPFASVGGMPRNCHWCGRKLRSTQTFFDTDKCGRLWAEQFCIRGLRLHAEEIVAVR